MKPLNLTFGSDPELIVVDGRNRPVSALRILKNTKHNPIDLGDDIKVYADNVLVEASMPPAPFEEIVDLIGDVLKRIKKALGEYSILAQSAIHYPSRELRNKGAWAVGCNPNFDAYLVRPNTTAKFTNGLRTGSFHIHIGNADWQKGGDERLLTRESKIQAIKLLDLYVGLASVVFDKDPMVLERRKLYGRAGEFRPTPYGVEYRVLGNYALRSPRLTSLVFQLVKLAMNAIEDGEANPVLGQMDEKDIIHIINNNDHEAALDAIQCIGLPKWLIDEIKLNDSPNLMKDWAIQ